MTYRWNRRARRYVDPNGRFVSQRAVRGALDRTLDLIARDLRNAARDVRNGAITVSEFARRMREGIKDAHIISAAIAKGGVAQLTASDYGRIGARVRIQYAYLDRRLGSMLAGTMVYNGRFLSDAALYAGVARELYYALAQIEARAAGATEERNILGQADHCAGCIAETARQWVPIGQLVPVGARTCLGNCQCRVEYR